ncbi:MAG: DUF4325 domain-containing protein [Rhodocyclaceae bacterium]|nr:DUF4325 domain-containing protein [Rhodocyclaceae bacterium]
MKPELHQTLKLIAQDGRNVGTRLSAALGITRQAASGRLKKLVGRGYVEATGATRDRIYSLKPLQEATAAYAIPGPSEDIVWRELCAPLLADLPMNVRDIWHYGITEMVNNAIDHSGSPTMRVGMIRNALHTTGWIADDGEGIFMKIQRALNLYDPRESIIELAKGKFTTDPAHHTGEGIFFSSKMFDAYDIRSGNLFFMHDDGELDILTERNKGGHGTLVMMRIDNASQKTSKAVFDQFSSPDEYTFDKTIVPVRLAVHEGEKLVSRSQAKRITLRFERFRHVILDFAGVSEIGQAFADEIFRVFQNAHPTIQMAPTNMTAAVNDMVNRARNKDARA